MAGSKQLGLDLKQARADAGISAVQLGLQLGRGAGAISGWERGLSLPDDEVRPKVAKFLGMSEEAFLARYYVARGRQDGPTASQEEAIGARARKRLEWELRLSDQEARLLRRLLERLEGTG